MAPKSTENITLKMTRLIKAPRERVFEAWTNPEQLKEWFQPGEDMVIPQVKVDLRAGGKYRIQMKNAKGEFYTSSGTYREVKPPERLVFTFAWEKDGSEADFGELEPTEMLISLEFHARGEETELVFTQEKLASIESLDSHARRLDGMLR